MTGPSSFTWFTNTTCDTIDHGYQCKPSISHFWGQYSLWYSVPSEIDVQPPAGCDVTFANVLSRHGGRDPTTYKNMAYALLIAQIQNSNTTFPAEFQFLRNYTFNMGIDQLTDAGRQEMTNSGIHFFRRYSQLLKDNTPFVRAGGQARVVESAEKWLDGLAQSLGCEPAKVDLVIPECSSCNNTLSHDTCLYFDSGPDSDLGYDAQQIWVSLFIPPIQTRINAALGTNLTSPAIINLMEMCPF